MLRQLLQGRLRDSPGMAHRNNNGVHNLFSKRATADHAGKVSSPAKNLITVLLFSTKCCCPGLSHDTYLPQQR
jgi:hypothetical protein